MSITSKIVLSALLAGVTLPALAQGTAGVAVHATPAPSAHHAPLAHAPLAHAPLAHAPLAHKVAAPVDITKPAPAPISGKPATVMAKPDAAKSTVNTGIAKPVVPSATGTVTPAAPVKSN